MIDKKIGLIGCGNMGEAILARLSEKLEKSTMIMVSEFDAARRGYIFGKYKIIVAVDNNLVVKNSDIIILAIKPKDIDNLLKNEIAIGASSKKLIISIAAGVTTKHIESIIGKDVPVIRIMPNIPAIIGRAISSLSPGKAAKKSDIDAAKEIFSLIGDVVEIEERLVDAVTAISGSGPAYFFYLMEAMTEAGESLGLPRKVAKKLVLKTAVGGTLLAEYLGEEPALLRARVSSKGGTTEAAIKVFEEKRFKSIVKAAIKNARKRSKKLSKA
jgi:pyrroline-5-carboxylate reductase